MSILKRQPACTVSDQVADEVDTVLQRNECIPSGGREYLSVVVKACDLQGTPK
jgi:hypothetical protein